MLESAKIRFLRYHDAPERKLLREFARFVKRFIEENLSPLEEEPDFDIWLEHTHYSAKEKKRLKRIHDELIGEPRSYYKEFLKKEFMNAILAMYDMCIKSGRMINGICDKFKVFVGKWISAIEKVVYKLKWFAKYIPVIMRPRVIFERLGVLGGPFVVTDYTSFESSFHPKLQKICESALVKHMLKNFPKLSNFISEQMFSMRRIYSKYYSIKVPGLRMSGDCHTSLANGFTNLMLTLFCAHKAGVACDGLVEGDDGLFYFGGDVSFEFSERLGFDIKKEVHSTIFDTKFCGLCFSGSLAAFSDPAYNICKLGWSFSPLRNRNRQTRLGLLRAKSLSLFYNTPRCPILTAAAKAFIRLTEGYRPIYDRDYWIDGQVREMFAMSEEISREEKLGITDEDRAFFEHMYGVPQEIQRQCEEYFCRLRAIEPICDGPVMFLFEGRHRWHANFESLTFESTQQMRL